MIQSVVQIDGKLAKVTDEVAVVETEEGPVEVPFKLVGGGRKEINRLVVVFIDIVDLVRLNPKLFK